MSRHRLAILGLSALLVAAFDVHTARAAEAHGGLPSARVAGAQTLAVPAYFDPHTTDGQSLWTRLNQTAPRGTIAIMDVTNSGPGPVFDPVWEATVSQAQHSGIRILCYIETKNDDGTLRPLADVRADIPRCLEWYHPDGIFFDETGSTATGSLDRLSDIATLHGDVKRQQADAIVALNPGQGVDEQFTAYSDIICIFEGPWSSGNYNFRTWAPDTWVTQGVASGKYSPNHFWTLVYSTPTATAMKAAVSRSKSLGIGDIYVTDEQPSSLGWLAWDRLPAYWQSEISAVTSP